MPDRRSDWIANPQRVWTRRALFQVHLCTGLTVGLYVVVMSVTGAAIVFRGELGRLLTPLQSVVPSGRRKSIEELKAVSARLHPGFTVSEVRVSSKATAAVEIVLIRGARRRDRIFDPYTGRDLGDRVPREPRSIESLAELHDNLLGGPTGRTINGIGAVCFTMLCLTGGVIWWPGLGRWRRSMTVHRHGSWRLLAWDAHSAIGFWLFPFLLMWAISGIYLAFPEPFNFVVDTLRTIDGSGRAGAVTSAALSDLSELHFGRFAGTPTKIVWVTLGLAPAILFTTGLFMWWTRVVRSRNP